MLAAGVDGAGRAGGWVVVVLKDDHLHASSIHADLDSVLAACEDVDAIAIDMPIGHEVKLDDGKRQCDVEAREFLGPARARSIFWVPPPEVLRAPDVDAALRLADRNGWIRASPLLWGLRGRLLEAHEAAKDRRVIEVHPEVSFTALARERRTGEFLHHPKTTWDGLVERLELLHAANLRPTRSLGGLGRASPDDVLDATIAAWSAARYARNEARSLPARPPTDPETRRPVCIWS